MNTQEALVDLAGSGSRLRSVLTQAFAKPLTELERRLSVERGPDPVGSLCADLFLAGGKRLRALAVFIVAAAKGVGDDVAVQLAEAIELTHGATLLHDDVIDEADTRRGRLAARRRWSNTLSVLGGDYLLLRSLDTVAELGVPPLTAAHRRTVDELLGSEVAQHLAKRDGDLSTAGYLGIAAGKTGSLFAFACAAPALYCGDEGAAFHLRAFGNAFGIAFQTADDVRDVATADPTKPGLLDLEDGVLSLPLRMAAQMDAALAADLLAAVSRAPTAAQRQRLAERIRATNATAEAIATGRRYLQRAMDSLAAVDFEVGALAALGAWLAGELDELEP